MKKIFKMVGPVLQASLSGRAIAAAIVAENPKASVVDRGSYLRVSVPNLCTLSQTTIEKFLADFHLPADLETVMSSFSGQYEATTKGVSWR